VVISGVVPMPRRRRLVAACERHPHSLAGLMLLKLGLLADTGVGGILVPGGSILGLLLRLEWSCVVRTAHRAPPGVLAYFDLTPLVPVWRICAQARQKADRSRRSPRVAPVDGPLPSPEVIRSSGIARLRSEAVSFDCETGPWSTGIGPSRSGAAERPGWRGVLAESPLIRCLRRALSPVISLFTGRRLAAPSVSGSAAPAHGFAPMRTIYSASDVERAVDDGMGHL
jgi:hypothetical protein